MAENGLLSVVVTVYNVEQYIEKCVDSILQQSYSNLEIILVNDGSTDSSGDICDKLSMKDSRIKVIHRENGGAAAAKNSGIKAASGEWLGIVDGDDWIEPEMYEKLYCAAVKDSADMAICGYRLVMDGEVIRNELPGDRSMSSLDAFRMLFSEKDVMLISPCNKLYSKKVYSMLNYPEGKRYEDEFVTHNVIAVCDRIAVVNSPEYNYRQRENSLTHSKFTTKHLDQVEGYYRRFLFLSRNGPKEFLSESCQRFSDFYIEAKKQFVPQSYEDRQRMKEIDTYAKDILPVAKKLCSRKTCLRLAAPAVYCLLGRLKSR